MEKLTLKCLVGGEAVDVTVCWPASEVELVNAKWPDGVDIDVISKPGYEGMGNAAQREWLARAARHLALRQGIVVRRDGKLIAPRIGAYEKPRVEVIGPIPDDALSALREQFPNTTLEHTDERMPIPPPPAAAQTKDDDDGEEEEQEEEQAGEELQGGVLRERDDS